MTDKKKMAERLRAEPWALLHDAADMIEALQAEVERERNSRQAAQIENEALKARLASAPLPKTQLDDAQIFEISRQWSNVSFARSATRFCTDFARAIERAHGIK